MIDRIAEAALTQHRAGGFESRGRYGIKRAEEASIETLVMSREDYADPVTADQKIVDALLERGVEYVVMAGYMRMVRTPMLRRLRIVWSTCIRHCCRAL